MTLRCLVDGLLLPAELCPVKSGLVAHDGDESFAMEALEALFYEVVSATPDELLGLQRLGYRLLRQACDFRWMRT